MKRRFLVAQLGARMHYAVLVRVLLSMERKTIPSGKRGRSKVRRALTRQADGDIHCFSLSARDRPEQWRDF